MGSPGCCPPGQEANLVGAVGGDGNWRNVVDTETQGSCISAFWGLPAGVPSGGSPTRAVKLPALGLGLRPGFGLSVLSHVIPAQSLSALPAPLWTAVWTAAERLGGPAHPDNYAQALGSIAGLAFRQSGRSQPVVSFKPCAFLVSEGVFTGGCPSYPLPSWRFSGCPAGGTRPLNAGHGSAIEILH